MFLAFCLSSVERPEDVLFWFPVEWLLLPGQRSLCECPAHHRGDCIWKRRHKFHALFLFLMLKSLGLITLVLVLSMIERLLTKSTRVFELPLIMIFIFLLWIVPNLFFDLPKIISLIESVKTSLFLILPVSSGILPKISPPSLLLHLSLVSLTLAAVLPSVLSLKLNSFLKPSVITPPWTILGIFLLLITPPTYLCPLFKFFLMKFSMTPCLVKLFHLCVSISTFPSCWKYAYVHPVPKKGDRSNPSNYRPIALLSCISKAFESILNRKIQKHFSTSDLLCNRQYGFYNGRSTGDLLSLLTDSWSSPLRCFCETFSVALDISKAFDRVWHKSLLSKLPPLGVYPSLCSFISSFHSSCSISAVVDGHCSSPKPINSGIQQCSVLSPTLILLFINDLLSVKKLPYPFIFWWIHFALFDLVTGLTKLKTGCGRTLNFGSCCQLRFWQKEPGILQFLKNSVSSSIYSTWPSKLLSPYSSTTHSYHPLQH